MSEAILEIQRLARHFGDVRAVDDISFSVSRGQVFGFIGPNGAGKTTTMRIIATLDLPQAGDVRVAGLSAVDGGQIISHGGNALFDNNSNGSFTSTVNPL